MLSKPDAEPSEVLATLRNVESSPFGSIVSARPEYASACALLDTNPPLPVQAAVDIKRYLSDLNTLSRIITRTRKVDVAEAKAMRVSQQIEVTWTEAESRFYRAVLVWARERAMSNHGVVGFATIMPLRQAASCIPASLQRITNIHLRQLGEATDEDDELEMEDDMVEALSIAEDEGLVAATDELEGAIRGLRGVPDTKFEAFRRMLDQLNRSGMRQVMVFSFFKGTLAYLADQLEDDFRVAVMNGSTPMDERNAIMDRFRQGSIDLLLLSEVGSEGLDFEFCNVLVNYDLPWNPMKVEQRIGRLDRFGQTSEKIFIYNFHVPGTIETDIFERLYRRIRVFEESIGELEPIVRTELADLQRAVIDPTRTDDERQAEVDRIEEAMERRRQQLDELATVQGQLAGMDQLLIDGFVRDTEERGRFIGAAEIERLVREMLTSIDGSLRLPKGSDIHELVGSADLAALVARAGGDPGQRSLNEVDAMLRDQRTIFCTFDADVASRATVELLTIRHPIVRAARLWFEDHDAAALPRFGVVAIPEPLDEPALVLISVAETTGLLPSLELWSSAVGLRSLQPMPDLGDRLLSRLTSGEIDDGVLEGSFDLSTALTMARAASAEMLNSVQSSRLATNESLVATRQQGVQSSFDRRLATDRDLLAEHVRNRRSEQIIRLYRSKIANLERRRDAKLAELVGSQLAAVTTVPEAVILVVPKA